MGQLHVGEVTFMDNLRHHRELFLRLLIDGRIRVESEQMGQLHVGEIIIMDNLRHLRTCFRYH
jgi:hypothetical protein